MSPVANELDVVGANATLQRTMTSTIGMMEPVLYTLHAAANKESRIILMRYDGSSSPAMTEAFKWRGGLGLRIGTSGEARFPLGVFLGDCTFPLLE